MHRAERGLTSPDRPDLIRIMPAQGAQERDVIFGPNRNDHDRGPPPRAAAVATMVTSERTGPRIAVIGSGVIGLAIAWTLAQDGCAVDLHDDQPGLGASHAAAGMLAPVSEATYEEPDLLALGLASLRAWPEFAARLTHASGIDVGLRAEGSLLVGFDMDDAVALARIADLLTRHDLQYDRLTSREAHALEPALSPHTRSALHVPGDPSVDNRLVVRALLAAAEGAGVRLHRQRVGVVTVDGRAVGVRRAEADADADQSNHPTAPVHQADLVVLAAGAGSAHVPGLPDYARPPVRPVKGQILRLGGAAGLLGRTVRATVHGEHVYLVPRSHGELVVGATSEEVGADLTVTAGAVHQLLRTAIEVVPEVAELELVEALARCRPGTPDNGPLIGSSLLPGLLLATGHYRSGVLLAPATSDAIHRLVSHLPVPGVIEPFAPQRFSASGHDIKEGIA